MIQFLQHDTCAVVRRPARRSPAADRDAATRRRARAAAAADAYCAAWAAAAAEHRLGPVPGDLQI